MEQREEALKKLINDLFKNISNYPIIIEDYGKTRISIISPPAVKSGQCITAKCNEHLLLGGGRGGGILSSGSMGICTSELWLLK